jgi:hypothetical protein
MSRSAIVRCAQRWGEYHAERGGGGGGPGTAALLSTVHLNLTDSNRTFLQYWLWVVAFVDSFPTSHFGSQRFWISSAPKLSLSSPQSSGYDGFPPLPVVWSMTESLLSNSLGPCVCCFSSILQSLDRHLSIISISSPQE